MSASRRIPRRAAILNLKTIALALASVAALAACNPAAQTDAAPEAQIAEGEPAPTGASAAYEGTWAAEAAGCAIPQDLAGAPHVFGADGYDQHEAHCTYAVVEQTAANAWRIGAACSVEGDEQSMGWNLVVDGDAMTMDGNTHLVRCP